MKDKGKIFLDEKEAIGNLPQEIVFCKECNKLTTILKGDYHICIDCYSKLGDKK